jgi:ubiquinone/menaquinone biosynthesis C-methylase UbiE
MDWGIGCYERTAEQLMPIAEAVVDAAAPVEGERVVDVGCGTGNAALLAAERGALVTGVDPAERLLAVAASRVDDLGLEASFALGEAASMPIEDGVTDLLLSVFGAIFAPDASAAVAEMARVTAPGGRIVLSAWIPEGAISNASRVGREAVARALGAPEGAPGLGFAWHDVEALAEAFRPFGFLVAAEERSHAFVAPSVDDWIESETRNHPLQVAGAAVLEARGEANEVLGRVREIYEAANEDPDAFKVTSRYVIATARREP